MGSSKPRLLFQILLLVLGLVSTKSQEGSGEPLFLTPLIKSGEFERAQEIASVPEFLPVIGYTGFITVNETANSNLFFWFFPAETSYNDDYYNNDTPIILWSDGGPGEPCLKTVFGNSGPFLPTGELNYTDNPNSWHKRYHVIYLDNPVAVGFSHTTNGLVHSAKEAAIDIYEFLQQFFLMFPHLQGNTFYNAGTSYGGRYSTEIAHYIHSKNMEGPQLFINLTGIIHDSPWYEGKTEFDYANVLYGAGLINTNDREYLLEKEDEFKGLIAEERLIEADDLFGQYVAEDVPRMTGYFAMYDLIRNEAFSNPTMNYTKFLELDSTRRAIHAGNLTFEWEASDSLERLGMKEDFVGSSAASLDDLLNYGYKFLMFIGNADLICGHVGIRNVFEQSLTWEGADWLMNGNRTIWREGDGVVGYITSYEDKARVIIMRNVGHQCYVKQPKLWMEALMEFIG